MRSIGWSLFCAPGAALVALVVLAVAAPAADNPPAPGFDAAGSDARAIQVADRSMEAMGGRPAASCRNPSVPRAYVCNRLSAEAISIRASASRSAAPSERYWLNSVIYN